MPSSQLSVLILLLPLLLIGGLLAAGDEDFVTALFAEFDPRGWLELVTCGHPPPLRLKADGDLQALNPTTCATPLGLHPDIQPSTFAVGVGERLVFYTDGLLEARDRAGRYFRLEDCLDAVAPHRPGGGRRRGARPAPGPYRAQARRRRRGAAIRSDVPIGPATGRAPCDCGTGL